MKKSNICQIITIIFLFLCPGLLLGQISTPLLGDVDGNGTINIVDALQTARYSVGFYPKGFVAELAEVSGDDTINISDALMIARYVVGNLDEFPAQRIYSEYTVRLEKARKGWDSIKPDHYTYEYNRLCFCLDARYTYLVEVKEGVVVSVLNMDENTLLEEEEWQRFNSLDGLFDIARAALDAKKGIMSLEFDPLYHYPASVGIDNIKLAIDDEVTHVAANLRALRKAVITSRPAPQEDPFRLARAAVTGDILTLNLEYGGGCVEHDLVLYVSDSFMESYPVQVNAYLYHEDNDDMCDAWLTPQVGFDLTPLAELYAKSYGGPTDPIHINLHHYFTGKPGEITQLVYTPVVE